MPRKNQSAEKRKLILEAFERCLHRGSLESLTIRQIAAEAGIPSGSINFFFKSKMDLILAYYQEHLSGYEESFIRFEHEISPAISNWHEFYDAYCDFVRQYYAFESQYSQTHYAVFYYSLFCYPEISELFKSLNEKNAAHICAAIRRTSFLPRDPVTIAHALLAQLDGYTLYSSMACRGQDRQSLFDSLNSANLFPDK